MDDAFQTRVRAAAGAAWRTILAAFAFIALQWVIYLAAMSLKPEWVRTLWGPGSTWESIRATWFYAIAVLKLTLWLLVLAALWLTLWARQMEKRPRTP